MEKQMNRYRMFLIKSIQKRGDKKMKKGLRDMKDRGLT